MVNSKDFQQNCFGDLRSKLPYKKEISENFV